MNIRMGGMVDVDNVEEELEVDCDEDDAEEEECNEADNDEDDWG